MKKEKIFYTKELNVLCRKIYEKTGYYFRDYSLLTQAFTRSSYSAECGGESNEILEFIGDQVLSYFVVKIIAERLGALNGDCEYAFRVRENKFTAIKQELVCNEALAKIIDELFQTSKYYVFSSTAKFKILSRRLKKVVLTSIKYIVYTLKNSRSSLFHTCFRRKKSYLICYT